MFGSVAPLTRPHLRWWHAFGWRAATRYIWQIDGGSECCAHCRRRSPFQFQRSYYHDASRYYARRRIAFCAELERSLRKTIVKDAGVANFDILAMDLFFFLGCRDRPKKTKNTCTCLVRIMYLQLYDNYSISMHNLVVIHSYLLLFSKSNSYIRAIYRYISLQKKKYFICILKKIRKFMRKSVASRDRQIGHPCYRGLVHNFHMKKFIDFRRLCKSCKFIT
jgi:hypothetical protein